MSTGTHRGRVVWWNDEKGCGVVRHDVDGSDAPVHWSNVLGNGRRTLIPGQRVTFELRWNTEHGAHASSLRVVESAPVWLRLVRWLVADL